MLAVWLPGALSSSSRVAGACLARRSPRSAVTDWRRRQETAGPHHHLSTAGQSRPPAQGRAKHQHYRQHCHCTATVCNTTSSGLRTKYFFTPSSKVWHVELCTSVFGDIYYKYPTSVECAQHSLCCVAATANVFSNVQIY